MELCAKNKIPPMLVITATDNAFTTVTLLFRSMLADFNLISIYMMLSRANNLCGQRTMLYCEQT